MATLTLDGFSTMANLATRMEPDGSGAKDIANVLSKEHAVLSHIPWKEGNTQTGHLITQSGTALPSASWRSANQGIAATQADTQQFLEACGRLEDESKLDEMLAELESAGGDNGATFRMSEDMLKMEGFAQQFVTAVFYESVLDNPERIHGLSPRYPATSGFTPSDYVLVGGSPAGVNAHSIWLISWAERKIYGIYPKGTKAGLERKDMGLQRVQDDASSLNSFWAWVTKFVWRCGIAVEDYRYAVRAQWDPDDAEMADSEKGLISLVTEMFDTIYKREPMTRYYMNRTSLRKLNQQLVHSDANILTYVSDNGGLVGDPNLGGNVVPALFGIPVSTVDELTSETAIS